MDSVLKCIRFRFGFLTLCAFSLFNSALTGGEFTYPETPAINETLSYGPVQLTDPFTWLEDKTNPEVEAWFHTQNDFARKHIAQMPFREEIFQRIKEIDEAKSVQIYSFARRGERYFYLKQEIGDEVGILYYRDGIDSEGIKLVEPAQFGDSNGVLGFDFYEPSLDGKRVAFGIASGGSEIPDLYVVEVDTGKVLDLKIPRVRSVPSWIEDGSGFFYRQMRPVDPSAPPAEKYQRTPVKFHRLGTDPSNDPVIVSYDKNPTPGLTPVNSVSIFQTIDSDYTFAYVANGVDRAFSLFYTTGIDLENPDSTDWIELCNGEDRFESVDVYKDTIFFRSTKNTPKGKILKGNLVDYDKSKLVTVLPESDVVLTGITTLGDSLYITGMETGVDVLMKLDLSKDDSVVENLSLPLVGRVTLLDNDFRKDDFFISLTSWERAPAYYHFSPKTKSFTLSKLRPIGPFDAPEGMVVKRVMVKSHDGVEVPLTIIHKDTIELDGTNPTVVYGYGAYGISLRPSFSPMRLAWLERGGIWTVAHVRGGGELGKEWHDGGHIETKRNSWLDLNACAEYLIEQGYTHSKHIAAQGGSMGGVLVGRAMTSRPDLYAAIVSHVGNHNPVRNHMRANGPGNYPEYGNPLDPEEFPYVLAMDSYFAIKDGVNYPPMLLTSGYNDSRVDPWMPGKMAARLQQANPDGGPYFMRTEFEAGHGGVARSDIWAESADVYTFLLWALTR